MSRPLLILALLAAAGLTAGCPGKAPDRPVPAVPAEPAPATGTAGARPPVPDISLDEARKLWDDTARGLLDSFKSRVFDPVRDGLLEHAEGTLAVRAGDREATYRFTYDAANPPEDPVTFEVVSEPEGTAKGATAQARRWAIQACVGAYPVVVFYRPPTKLRLMPSSDKKTKDLIVWAPAFRGPLNVSYNVDERQVITSRGEWTDEAHKAVTRYDWEFWHGRYLMRTETIADGASLAFEYDDRVGVNLMSRVHVREQSQSSEAVFAYQNVRRRPN